MYILPFKRSQVKAVFGSTTCSAAGCVNTLVKSRAVSHQQGFVGAFTQPVVLHAVLAKTALTWLRLKGRMCIPGLAL